MAEEREWRVRRGSRAQELWRRWGYVGWVLVIAGLAGLLIGKLS